MTDAPLRPPAVPPAPQTVSRARLARGFAGRLAQGSRLIATASPGALRTLVLLQLGLGVASVLRLLSAKELVEALTSDGRASAVLPALSVIGASLLLSMAAALTAERQRLLVDQVRRLLESWLLDTTARAELLAFDDPSFTNDLERSQYGTYLRSAQLTQGVVGVLVGLIGAVAIFGTLFYLQPVLAVAVLVAYLPVWVATRRSSAAAFRFDLDYSEPERRRTYLYGLLTSGDAARELRAHGSAPFLRQWYETLYDDRITRLRVIARARLRRSVAATGLATTVAGAAVYVLVLRVEAADLSVATAVVAILGALELGTRLSSLYSSAAGLHESTSYLDDVEALRDRQGPAAAPGPVAVTRPDRERETVREVALRGVSFRYPRAERDALQGVDVRVRRGEVVALTGRNGSGKTTLAAVLCGLLPATAGEVVVNGEVGDPEAIREALRQASALVFQDFARFELTAGHNIAMGDLSALEDEQRLVRAAELSGADAVVARLPGGYDTLLGNHFHGGVQMSVGQWQKVALARALVRRSDLLVLDEPTSALDAEAEAEALVSLRRDTGGAAILLITHRLATVASRADRVVLLDEGRVVADGPHAELLTTSPLYAHLHGLQRGGS